MKKALLLILALSMASVRAQPLSVSGTIVAADNGLPVTGAAVVVKGSSIATLSDLNGAYKITIPEQAKEKVLSVHYTGLVTQEIPVTHSGVINIVMETDVITLENEVVTAYGTTSKQAFTGSATVVKAAELKNQQVIAPDAALQGLASGVLVVGGNGQSGEKSAVRIRGVGSIAGSGDPLVVIDGIAYNSDLNTVNPADIETMTVLKDANSTALYGSRAANGMIMITTKSGRPGKARVSATARYGISNRAVRNYEFVGAGEYLEMLWQGIYNTCLPSLGDQNARIRASEGLIPDYVVYNPYGSNPRYAQPVGTDGKTVAGARLLYDTDWYDALTRLGRRQEYDVQISGGSEATKYLFSLGALNDKGIIQASGFERYTGRIKVDSKVRDWLGVGVNSSLSYSSRNYPLQKDACMSNTIGFINGISNIYPLYELDADGNRVLDANGDPIPDYGRGEHPGTAPGTRPIMPGSNPYGTATLNKINHDRFMSSNNVYAEANFMKDFKFKSSFGFEYYNDDFYYNPPYGDGAAHKDVSGKTRNNYMTLTWINTLTYDKTIKDKHHLNVLAGIDSYNYRYSLVSAERMGFDSPGQSETQLTEALSENISTRNVRYLMRANYDFDNRYHLSASYTHDGTSRFKGRNRWGSFYSAGAAWNVSNEDFFLNGVGEWWSNFKMRASYGTSGNQNISYFPYMGAGKTDGNILGGGGSTVYRPVNEDMTWEKQDQFDVGLDFGFLSGALTFTATYFNRISRDLLLARPLPNPGGTEAINGNTGKIRNSGLELEIGATPVDRKDVTWDIGFNITYLKNKMLALPQANLKGGMSQPGYKQLFVGRSAYTWYLPEFAGVNPDNGMPAWWMDADPSNPGKGRAVTEDYGSATKYCVGDALPKWYGGISTNLAFRGFDLGIIGAFSIGGKILDMDKASLMHLMSAAGGQVSADTRRAWKKQGDATDVAALTVGNTDFNAPSTRWLVDASYFRLRNLTVGYDLASIPSIKNSGFKSLRFYFSADNLFTIFGSKGLDPEQGLSGYANYTSSALRTFSIGINVGF